MTRQALLALVLLFLPFGVNPHLLTGTDMGNGEDHSSKAPDFTLIDFDGQKLTLSQHKGKVVLLDFWASWCAPCQAEIPRFVEWQKKYGQKGFQVIGLSMDDDEKTARKFAARLKPNYPVAMGSSSLAESYGGILGLPANLVIGRDGRIVAKHVGATDLETLEHEIESQLSLPSPLKP